MGESKKNPQSRSARAGLQVEDSETSAVSGGTDTQTVEATIEQSE